MSLGLKIIAKMVPAAVSGGVVVGAVSSLGNDLMPKKTKCDSEVFNHIIQDTIPAPHATWYHSLIPRISTVNTIIQSNTSSDEVINSSNNVEEVFRDFPF